jgi:hypothetical protein
MPDSSTSWAALKSAQLNTIRNLSCPSGKRSLQGASLIGIGSPRSPGTRVGVGGGGTVDGGSPGRGTVDVWVTACAGFGGLFHCE